MLHNIPLPSPGWFARPLDLDELDLAEVVKISRPHAEYIPVELIRVYGVQNCPLSYGKFWDVQSATDYVNLHFNL